MKLRFIDKKLEERATDATINRKAIINTLLKELESKLASNGLKMLYSEKSETGIFIGFKCIDNPDGVLKFKFDPDETNKANSAYNITGRVYGKKELTLTNNKITLEQMLAPDNFIKQLVKEFKDNLITNENAQLKEGIFDGILNKSADKINQKDNLASVSDFIKAVDKSFKEGLNAKDVKIKTQMDSDKLSFTLSIECPYVAGIKLGTNSMEPNKLIAKEIRTPFGNINLNKNLSFIDALNKITKAMGITTTITLSSKQIAGTGDTTDVDHKTIDINNLKNVKSILGKDILSKLGVNTSTKENLMNEADNSTNISSKNYDDVLRQLGNDDKKIKALINLYIMQKLKIDQIDPKKISSHVIDEIQQQVKQYNSFNPNTNIMLKIAFDYAEENDKTINSSLFDVLKEIKGYSSDQLLSKCYQNPIIGQLMKKSIFYDKRIENIDDILQRFIKMYNTYQTKTLDQTMKQKLKENGIIATLGDIESIGDYKELLKKIFFQNSSDPNSNYQFRTKQEIDQYADALDELSDLTTSVKRNYRNIENKDNRLNQAITKQLDSENPDIGNIMSQLSQYSFEGSKNISAEDKKNFVAALAKLLNISNDGNQS